MSKRFEFRIMSRNESCATCFEQIVENCARQCRALLWIGACTEFIEDDQRALVDLLKDADDVCDVTTECAEGLLDGLFIANIRIHRLEAGQLRAASRRDMESTLRHKSEQTNGFEGNRFPTGIRTCDHNGAGTRVGINVDGNHM